MWGVDQTVNSTRSQIHSSLIGQILLDFFSSRVGADGRLIWESHRIFFLIQLKTAP